MPYGVSDVLCGRFEILEKLGKAGQMAYAVRAHDRVTDDIVVLKILHDRSLGTALLSQYQKLKSIDSKQLARAIFYLEHHDGANVEPILVLEYVEGLALSDWVSTRGKRDRLQILANVSLALAELQDRGLEHGDVHSENVIVTPQGRIVLIDPQAGIFGSTKLRTVDANPLTDRLGFLFLAEELFVGNEEHAVEPVLMPLRDDVFPPTFRAVASQTRALLESENLPGEMNGSLTDLARWNANDVSSRHALYGQIVDARQTAFFNLIGVIQPVADILKLTVSSSMGDWERARQEERVSVERPRGRFQNRIYAATTEDGDAVSVTMEGTADFRKPFFEPTRPDLVGRGHVTVTTAEGTLISSEKIEFCWTDMVVAPWIVFGRHRLLLGVASMERAMRLLCGATYAVFPSPQTFSKSKTNGTLFNLAAFGVTEKLASGAGATVGVSGLIRGIQIALATSEKEFGGLGLDLARIVEGSVSTRQSRLEALRERFIERFGQYFDVIYRLDIAMANPQERLLTVMMESTINGRETPSVWQFAIVLGSPNDPRTSRPFDENSDAKAE